jgi:hypothetical protein
VPASVASTPATALGARPIMLPQIIGAQAPGADRGPSAVAPAASKSVASTPGKAPRKAAAGDVPARKAARPRSPVEGTRGPAKPKAGASSENAAAPAPTGRTAASSSGSTSRPKGTRTAGPSARRPSPARPGEDESDAQAQAAAQGSDPGPKATRKRAKPGPDKSTRPATRTTKTDKKLDDGTMKRPRRGLEDQG